MGEYYCRYQVAKSSLLVMSFFLLDLLLGLLTFEAEPLVDLRFEEAELFAVFVDGDAVLAYPVVDC